LEALPPVVGWEAEPPKSVPSETLGTRGYFFSPILNIFSLLGSAWERYFEALPPVTGTGGRVF